MFVESFQGQYKDGTNGTRDFRIASASFLILKILILVSFVKGHHPDTTWILSNMRCGFFVSVSCLYTVMKPYRLESRNNADILILVLLGMLSLTFFTAPKHLGGESEEIMICIIIISILLLGIPHMVLILYICYLLAKKTGITQCLERNFKRLATRCISQVETDESDAGSLPDRLINPGEYEPVPPTRERHTATATDKEPELGRLTPVYTYGSIN